MDRFRKLAASLAGPSFCQRVNPKAVPKGYRCECGSLILLLSPDAAPKLTTPKISRAGWLFRVAQNTM
jgi:hypothetical protein